MPAKVDVAWCPVCRWYLPAAEIGEPCPAFDCMTLRRPWRKLIRRVGYICPECIYFHFTQRELRACTHDEVWWGGSGNVEN